MSAEPTPCPFLSKPFHHENKIERVCIEALEAIERENHIGAGPYQRGVEGNGHANGFKPRTFQTAIGAPAGNMHGVRC
jgi:hypothetical protein